MPGKSNIRILFLSLALVTLFSAVAVAQGGGTPANAAPAVAPKIAIVNVQEAILSTNEGKKELDALQQRFAPRQTELRSLYSEIQTLQKQFEATQGQVTDEERATRARAIEAKQKTLQRNSDDFQADVQQAQQEIGRRIGGKMQSVLQKYAQDRAYWLVLDVSAQQNQVVWANHGTDITGDLVNAYNVQYPATPPAAAKPAVSTPNPTIKKP
ncbi:MAG TPA: OmpH family outer membrane protein [Terriglobales bacterium]|nr:OmpH family outer membrane protein [Terriglobales bacterium]